MCGGVPCTDPNENDRVVEPIGEDKYNVRDGKMTVLRGDVAGLTQARDIARNGANPGGRTLWSNREANRIEYYNLNATETAE